MAELIERPAKTEEAVAVDPAGSELARINAELARLLGISPASLLSGADTARRDPLVVCGLLGGKDVGKSTLINALAGQEVSVDREEVGAGTSRPLVYVHRDMVAVARERFAEAVGGSGADELQFFPHQADSIRNVALIDLPDFDSDFRRHEAIARSVAPSLDRVIWVVTPRKIADRAWVSFARDVVKATGNVYFALNKSDELLADEEGWTAHGRSEAEVAEAAETFARDQRDWACEALAQAGYNIEPEGLFLVAARFPQAAVFVQRVASIWDDPTWRRYGDDRDVVTNIGKQFTRDLHRLRDIVLAPVDPELAARIKRENLRAQLEQNVRRVREHFDLDHWTDQATRPLSVEYRQSLVNSAFGPEFCTSLAARLLRSRRSDVELADEVMDARAGRWPVLRVVYWLSRWVIRRLGRAMAGGAARDHDRSLPGGRDLFRIRARGLDDRVELIVDRLEAEHGPVLRQLRVAERLPSSQELAARVESELAELPVRGDEELVDRLSRDYRPSFFGRLLVLFAAVWFPFVQPIAEGLLEISSARMDLTDMLHGLYRVVVALGAVQLLHGLAVVAIICVAALAAIYGRCVRDVQAGRVTPAEAARGRRRRRLRAADLQEEIDTVAQEVDGMLAGHVVGPMLQPLESAASQLADLSRRLEQVTSQN